MPSAPHGEIEYLIQKLVTYVKTFVQILLEHMFEIRSAGYGVRGAGCAMRGAGCGIGQILNFVVRVGGILPEFLKEIELKNLFFKLNFCSGRRRSR